MTGWRAKRYGGEASALHGTEIEWLTQFVAPLVPALRRWDARQRDRTDDVAEVRIILRASSHAGSVSIYDAKSALLAKVPVENGAAVVRLPMGSYLAVHNHSYASCRFAVTRIPDRFQISIVCHETAAESEDAPSSPLKSLQLRSPLRAWVISSAPATC